VQSFQEGGSENAASTSSLLLLLLLVVLLLLLLVKFTHKFVITQAAHQITVKKESAHPNSGTNDGSSRRVRDDTRAQNSIAKKEGVTGPICWIS